MRDHTLDDARTEQVQLQIIQPLEKRKVRLPFRFLRTWIFSVLALVTLPAGIMLMLVGLDMDTNLETDWIQTTAIVERNDEEAVEFSLEEDGFDIEGSFGYTLDYFVDVPVSGQLGLFVSACDLVRWVTIPQERGETFPVWVNPDKPILQSCVPITRDVAPVYISFGMFLIVLSAFRLLRTINAAALKR